MASKIAFVPFAGYYGVKPNGSLDKRVAKDDPQIEEAKKAGLIEYRQARAATLAPALKAPEDDDMKNLRELANQILSRVSAEGQKTDLWQEKLAKHAEVVERMLNDLGEQVKIAVNEIRNRDNLLKELAAKSNGKPAPAAPAVAISQPSQPPRPIPTGGAAPTDVVAPFGQRIKTKARAIGSAVVSGLRVAVVIVAVGMVAAGSYFLIYQQNVAEKSNPPAVVRNEPAPALPKQEAAQESWNIWATKEITTLGSRVEQLEADKAQPADQMIKLEKKKQAAAQAPPAPEKKASRLISQSGFCEKYGGHMVNLDGHPFCTPGKG